MDEGGEAARKAEDVGGGEIVPRDAAAAAAANRGGVEGVVGRGSGDICR